MITIARIVGRGRIFPSARRPLGEAANLNPIALLFHYKSAFPCMVKVGWKPLTTEATTYRGRSGLAISCAAAVEIAFYTKSL